MAIANIEKGRINHMHSFKQDGEESAKQGRGLSLAAAKKRGIKGRYPVVGSLGA